MAAVSTKTDKAVILNVPRHMEFDHHLEWLQAGGKKPTVPVVQKLHALHDQIHAAGESNHTHPDDRLQREEA